MLSFQKIFSFGYHIGIQLLLLMEDLILISSVLLRISINLSSQLTCILTSAGKRINIFAFDNREFDSETAKQINVKMTNHKKHFYLQFKI